MMRFTIFFAVVSLAGFIACAFAQRPAMNPVTRAYGEAEFKLGPDDVVEVFVYKEPELSPTVVVRPDGKISLPLIGELMVNGKSALELQREVTQKLAQYIAEPSVNVIVKEVNSAKVSVLGEVKTPGMYKIKDRATILDAVALAGGFTEYARRDKVTLIRIEPNGQQHRIQINVEDQIKGRKATCSTSCRTTRFTCSKPRSGSKNLVSYEDTCTRPFPALAAGLPLRATSHRWDSGLLSCCAIKSCYRYRRQFPR